MKDAPRQVQIEVPGPGDVHVVPTFGRSHAQGSCWCGPKADPVTLDREKYANVVWIHEVQQ